MVVNQSLIRGLSINAKRLQKLTVECSTMAFEKFESTGQGRGGGETVPKISLRKSGSIGINNEALEEFFEDAGAVVMYFDEDENRVGLKPVEDKEAEDGAYTLSRSDSGGSVTPSSFLNKHGLIPDITTQYEPEMVKVNQNLELISIDLNNEYATYGSRADEEEAEADD